MSKLDSLARLWNSQVLSARQRQSLALRINQLLLEEPVGTKVRLGSALLEHIPRSLSVTLSNPTEDGYIERDGATYLRRNAPYEVQFMMYYGYIDRGYVEWGISSIPDGATITDTIFKYNGMANHKDGHIHEMLGARPSTQPDTNAGNKAIYDEAGEGTVYADPPGFPVVGTGQQVDLGASADSDLQSQLTANWFALGFQSDDETFDHLNDFTDFASEEDPTPPNPPPTLYVEYTPPAPPAAGGLRMIPSLKGHMGYDLKTRGGKARRRMF